MSTLNKRFVLAATLLGIVAVGALVYRVFLAENANAVATNAPRMPLAQPVIAGTVAEKSMPVLLTAIGTVQPVNSVAVRPRLDSQITRVLVQDGGRVEAGDPLFELDRRQLEAQRAQAEAMLARDEAQLAYALRNLQRTQPGISAESAIDEARTSVTTLQAAVRADRASLESLAVQLSHTRIAAPIGGRLGTIAFKVGSIVKASDPQPLVTINQLRPVYLAFSVPESALPVIQQALAAGEVPVKATVSGPDAAPEYGRVSYLENAVDISTHTISVKAFFPNDREQLWPGSYVNVEVTLRQQDHARVVPAQAVQMSQNGTYVFVIDDDDTVTARDVTVDRLVAGEAVIAKGLNPGERIVVVGQLRLTNGARVEVQAAAAEGRK